MPEMNMTFQCCFVILESSIRESKSVSLINASDIVLSLARSLPKQLRTAL
jgi:hypothetical protein